MTNIKLYNKDCLDAMREMEDNEFDLAIVDPPYGLREAGAHSHISGTRKLFYDLDKYESWDKKPSQLYFDELRRVSKNQIIFGMNYFSDMLPPSRCFIVWDNLNRGLSFSQAELAWCSFKQMSKVVRMSSRQLDRIHRCQKPVDLYLWIMSRYAQPGDKILDTHLGSGSSALAAHDLGFDFVGYEIDTEYYEKAQDRLQQHQKQLTLF
jgi:site-specific DNA-methyltransferase (adenine-specific)